MIWHQDCLTTLINSMIVFFFGTPAGKAISITRCITIWNCICCSIFRFRTKRRQICTAFSAIYIHCKGIDITAIICSQYKTAICPDFSFQYRSIPIQIKARIDLCIFFDRYFAVGFSGKFVLRCLFISSICFFFIIFYMIWHIASFPYCIQIHILFPLKSCVPLLCVRILRPSGKLITLSCRNICYFLIAIVPDCI